MERRDLFILIILVSILLISCIVWLVLNSRTKKRKKRGKTNWQHRLGTVYQHLPLLRGEYRKLRSRVMLVEPGDIVDANARTTNIVTRSLGLSLLVIIAAALMAGGDLYFTVAGLFVAYIIFTQTARSRIERMELELLTEFSDFLADIRHYYHERKLVDEAIYMTLDSLPYGLSLHIHRIYDMVTSPDATQAAERYVQGSPNRFFTTFASICASITDYGDKQLENGSSLFLSNLNYLKEEVNMELLRRQNLAYLFKGLVTISIFPVIFIKPIEYWARNIMEGMEHIYSGIYGLAAMLAIFAITFLCYTLVCILHDDRRDQVVEDSIWRRISAMPVITQVLNREINRHYTRALQTDMDLKSTGDQTGPKAFLLKRIVFGLVFGLSVLAVTVTVPFYQKSNLRQNFSEAFSSMSVADEAFLDTMQAVAAEKLAVYEKIPATQEEIAADIMETTELTQESYAMMVAQVILERIAQIARTYYKVFYLIPAFLAFLIGFWIPQWLLAYNLNVSQMGKEDEVNQFSTLMLIFMHVDRMTLSTILEWMERFAYSFQASITECLMNLDYGEQKALATLREREKHFPPFKRFVDNLLAIDSVGIEAAFDEIQTEREYYKEKRRLDSMELSRHKASRARMFAFIPLFSVIGLYLLAPMVIASVQMLSSLTQALGM